MKTNVMKKFYEVTCKRSVALFFSSVLLSVGLSAQQIVTYDTTFLGWNAVVTMDKALTGTDSAAGIVFFPGIGEETTDSSKIVVNGPHYLIRNGIWDGSVPLGNGVHHPFIISLQPPASGYPASSVKPKIDAILSRYRIKRNSFYLTGLSMGGWYANEFVCYEPTPGDDTYGRMVRALVVLEGVEPSDSTIIYNSLSYPRKMGHYAKACGGRELWVEGSNDWRDMLAGAQNMCDSVPNSASYFMVTYGGGSHCCWNTEYNPGTTWTMPSNTNISQVWGTPQPMNVWQWLLRQGDTSMPAYSTVPGPPAVSAGSAQTIQLPVSSLTLTGTATGIAGATISSVAWTEVSGPATAAFSAATNLTTGVSGLTTAGTYVFQLQATDNNGRSATATVTITVNAANVPPTANAGSAQTIQLPVSSVTLTGAASGNGGATISATVWTQVSGPVTATIAAAPSLTTSISAMTAPGTYVFQLKATDNHGLSATSTVTITVLAANVPPTVNAGTAQTIQLPVSSATLTGSASGNGGATIVSTVWSQVSGPGTGGFSAATSLSTVVSGMIAAGSYVFQLKATDNHGLTATSIVTITVSAANVPPSVNAGTAQTIQLPVSSATLTGTASGNGGAIIGSTVWTEVSGPATAAFSATTSLSTGVSGLTNAGTFVFQLTATDNNGLSSTATVTVTVNAANVPPTVSAGSAQTIQLPVSSVTLTGTASGNGGATISGTVWTEVSGPATASFTAATNLSTAASGLTTAGTYVFQLKATDNNNLSATSTVTVTVQAAAPPVNIPPTVSAGSDQTVQLPVSSATLSGTASGNGGATIVATTWTEVSGPVPATIVSASGLSTGVTGMTTAGSYVFELKATDNNGLSATDAVTINVIVANIPPTVNAGSDQTIQLPVSSVTLAGTASGNGGATISNTLWTEVSGPLTATIANPASLSTGISGLTAAGSYVFQLKATDNDGFSTTSAVTVTVQAAAPPVNVPPTVSAGSDQTIQLPVSSVTLTGTATGNGGATISSTTWTEVSGPVPAAIGSVSGLSTGVTGMTTAGSYVYELMATDNNGLSTTSAVTITVQAAAANVPPVANAGPNQVVTMPVTNVSLDGSGSSDVDGTITAYSWVQLSGNGGATIVGASQAQATLTGLTAGTYVFQLTVTDNAGATGVATVTITVNPATVLAPVANAGADTTIALPSDSVMLNGSGSSDPGGETLTYQWTEISGPTQALLGSSGSAATTAGGLSAGLYVFKLKVTNTSGLSDTMSVQVLVENSQRTAAADTAGAAFMVYPNPVSTILTIKFTDANTSGKVLLKVFDMKGRPMMSEQTTVSGGGQLISLDVSRLQRGVYTLEIVVGKAHGYQLIVKQ